MDTLGEVLLAARQRADMENSQFLTDAEWSENIRQSYLELYDLLAQKYGNDYFVAEPVTITADGTSDRYSLPDGTLYSGAPKFFKLLGLDLQINTDQWAALKQFNFADRNRFQSNYLPPPSYGYADMRYRLTGSKIWIAPRPTAGQQFQLWYVPSPTLPTDEADTFDSAAVPWLEYVVVDAAIKAMQKEESDVSVLFAQKQALIARISAAAENRDAGSPATVVDVYEDDVDGRYR